MSTEGTTALAVARTTKMLLLNRSFQVTCDLGVQGLRVSGRGFQAVRVSAC